MSALLARELGPDSLLLCMIVKADRLLKYDMRLRVLSSLTIVALLSCHQDC